MGIDLFKKTLSSIIERDLYLLGFSYLDTTEAKQGYEIGQSINKTWGLLADIREEVRDNLYSEILNAGVKYPELLKDYWRPEYLNQDEQYYFDLAKSKIIEAASGNKDYVKLLHNFSLKFGTSATSFSILNCYGQIVKALSILPEPDKIWHKILFNAHQYSNEVQAGNLNKLDEISNYITEFINIWKFSDELGEMRAKALIEEAKQQKVYTLEEFEKVVEEILLYKYQEDLRQSKLETNSFIITATPNIGRKKAEEIANNALWNTKSLEDLQIFLKSNLSKFLPLNETQILGQLELVFNIDKVNYIRQNTYRWPNITEIRNLICSLFESEHVQEIGKNLVNKISQDAFIGTNGIQDLVRSLNQEIEIYKSQRNKLIFPGETAERDKIALAFTKLNNSYQEIRYDLARQALLESINDNLKLINKLEDLWTDFLGSQMDQNLQIEAQKRKIITSDFYAEFGDENAITNATLHTLWASELKVWLSNSGNQINQQLEYNQITDYYKGIIGEAELIQAKNSSNTPASYAVYLENYLNNIKEIGLEENRKVIVNEFVRQNISVPTIKAISQEAISKTRGLDDLEKELNYLLAENLKVEEFEYKKDRQEIVREFMASKKFGDDYVLSFPIIQRIAEKAITMTSDNMSDLNNLWNTLEYYYQEEFEKHLNDLIITENELLTNFWRTADDMNSETRPKGTVVENIINTAINSLVRPDVNPSQSNKKEYIRMLNKTLQVLLLQWEDEMTSRFKMEEGRYDIY